MLNSIRSPFASPQPQAVSASNEGGVVASEAQATLISKGQPAVVSLHANNSTPYRWKVLNAPEGLAISQSYKTKPNPNRVMGVGGQALFSIEPGTAKPGVYEVELGYCRMGSSNAVNTKKITVGVKSIADETVAVSQGASATITLNANYTTPFTWKVMDAPEGVEVSTQYVSNPNPSTMMGMGGKLHVTMIAADCEPGTYQVQLGNFYIGDESQPYTIHTVDLVVS